MRRSVRVILMCVAVAFLAWMLSDQPSDTTFSLEMFRKHCADALDLELAKEYIGAKLPVIRYIVTRSYHSFGPNA